MSSQRRRALNPQWETESEMYEEVDPDIVLQEDVDARCQSMNSSMEEELIDVSMCEKSQSDHRVEASSSRLVGSSGQNPGPRHESPESALKTEQNHLKYTMGPEDQQILSVWRRRGAGSIEVIYDPPAASLDIVFCHGVTGSWRDPWMNTQTRRPWPETFIPRDTTKARILAFDGDALGLWNHLTKTTMRVYSTTLLEQLIQLRQRTTTTHRPITWIAHSLGGITVEDALTIADKLPRLQQIANNTIGAAFFATPQCGSDISRWRSTLDNFLSYIIPNCDHPCGCFPSTFVGPDHPDFTVLQRDFETLLTKRKTSGKEVQVISWYETEPIPGVGIMVPENSTKILQYDNLSMYGNHMDLAKYRPDRVQFDFSAETLLEDIKKWITQSLRSNWSLGGSRITTSRSNGLRGVAVSYKDVRRSVAHRNPTRSSSDESSNDSSDEASSGDSNASSQYSWRRKKSSGRPKVYINRRGSLPRGSPSNRSLSSSSSRGYDARHNRDMNWSELEKHTNLEAEIGRLREIHLALSANPTVAQPSNPPTPGDPRTVIRRPPPHRQQAPRNHQEATAMSHRSLRLSNSRTDLPQSSSRAHAASTNLRKVMAGPQNYTYSPISRPGTIRLLKLGTTEISSGTITAQLESVVLDHAPPFFALSYCWGNMRPDTPIICEDSTGSGRLLITATLAQALRRLQMLSNVKSTLHRGNRHVGSINMFGEQLSLSDLKDIISTGWHMPRVRKRLQELAEELTYGSEDQRIVAGYIRRLEISRWGSRFDLSDDPTGPRLCSFEELVPVLDRLIQVEEIDRAKAEVERGQSWDLTAKYFWIDQICINQSNELERNNQVKLMGKLYSRAIRTLIWLGDDGGNSHLALNLAEKIANLAAREDYSNGLPPPATIRRHAETGLPPLDKPEWPALGHLLSAEWFRRIWVVQEAVLSPQDALVLYGHSVHSWTRLRQAASWLYANAYEGLPISGIPPQVMNVDTFTQIQFQDTKWRMLAILDQTYNGFCAKIPLDKFYGILGLCAEFQGSQWPSILEPNYKLLPETVFRNVARFSIESSRNLAVLSLVCLGGRREHGPSWAPDLTGSPFYRGAMNEIFLEDDGSVGLRNWNGYRACLGFPLQLAASTNPDILALRGMQVDTIAFQMEEIYSFGWTLQDLLAAQRVKLDEAQSAIREAINDRIERFKYADRLSTQPEPELSCIPDSAACPPFLLRMWMNMVDASKAVEPWDVRRLAQSFHMIATAGQGSHGGVFGSNEEADQSFKNCCAYLVKALQTHGVGIPDYHKGFLKHACDLGDPDAFVAIAAKWCAGRRFFRTVDGLVGMGPGPMKEGDLVCLLFGGGVPYILRPKGRRYIFIGDCYVDGLMEGQAMSGLIAVPLFEIM